MDKPMNEREDCITMITDSGESVDFTYWKKQGSMEKIICW